ncbi:Competence protein [hydrothermal vent metagenome]|uniref:Competence protein n=1 Tax=hydrothermal vent metagenome TaxID=652676 RepID=A0A1W1CL90_9ZZZZ
MGMQLEKPKLFPEKQTFIWFVSILLLLIGIRLVFHYHTYQEFIAKPFYYTHATVITSYEKNKKNKRYHVLKLKSDEGFTFYTTSHRREGFKHKRLRLQIFPNESIKFRDYLGTFYVKSKIKYQEKLPIMLKDRLLDYVANQHQNSAMATFYNAIFFATPLEKALREKIALLGISHLVALSGFHLAILWGLVYGLLLLFYQPLQQKYFPYRQALFDVGIVAMTILGYYVWFVDFPPSLVRSFAMVLVGWGVLLLGIELLSFSFLVSVFLFLILLFPSLLVSLSFWLSAAGVFYIFLLLQYTKTWNKWLITLGALPIGIFMLMLPVVHTIFGVTSLYQLISPMLSLLFVFFYPFVILLHFLGLGGIFDTYLLWLFSLPADSAENIIPLGVALGYLGLSIVAIWYRKVFYLLLGLAILYMFYLFIFVEQVTKL